MGMASSGAPSLCGHHDGHGVHLSAFPIWQVLRTIDSPDSARLYDIYTACDEGLADGDGGAVGISQVIA